MADTAGNDPRVGLVQVHGGGLVPVPDPTKLTTEQLRRELDGATTELRREMAAMREFLTERHNQGQQLSAERTEVLAERQNQVQHERNRAIAAVREVMNTQIEGMREAIRLLVASVTRDAENLQSLLSSQISRVSDVALEKFLAVDARFASNDLAVTAALMAQEKAVAEQNRSNSLAISKSEQATKETISANAAQNVTTAAAQAAQIADLKERLVRLEAGGTAVSGERSVRLAEDSFGQAGIISRQQARNASISIGIAAFAAVISVIAVIVLALHH